MCLIKISLVISELSSKRVLKKKKFDMFDKVLNILWVYQGLW